MDNAVVFIVIGQAATFLTLLANIFVGLYRENRNREWQVQDRALDVKEREITALKLKQTTDATAAVVKQEASVLAAQLGAKIIEGTNHAQAAFKEANHVNIKIEDLNKRLVEQGLAAKEQHAIDAQQLDAIQTTGDDTNVKVTKIGPADPTKSQ